MITGLPRKTPHSEHGGPATPVHVLVIGNFAVEIENVTTVVSANGEKSVRVETSDGKEWVGFPCEGDLVWRQTPKTPRVSESATQALPLVLATDTEAKVNQAIKVPMMLKCPADGRLFDIIKWEPSVCVGEAVTAKVEVFIRVPDSSR